MRLFYFRLLFLTAILFCNTDLFAQFVIFDQDNTLIPMNKTTSIVVTNTGVVWVGTYDKGLARYDGLDNGFNSWEIINTATSGFPNNYINRLQLSGGELWVSTFFGGLGRYGGSTWSNFKTNNSSLPDNEVWGVRPDTKGNIWIATDGGLAQDSLPNNTWTVYTTSNTPGIPSNSLRGVAVDADDMRWIAAPGYGLVMYHGNKSDQHWHTYSTSNSDIPSDFINFVTRAPDGKIWIATNAGAAEFNRTSEWTVFNAENTDGKLFSDEINQIAFDGSNVFFATKDGLVMRYNDVWSIKNTENSNLPENNIKGVAINPNTKDVWVATASSGVAMLPQALLAVEEKIQDVNHVSLFVYPNPSSEIIQLTYTLPRREHAQLIISDIIGSEIFSEEYENNERKTVSFDVSGLKPGIYICRLLTANGMASVKLVVK